MRTRPLTGGARMVLTSVCFVFVFLCLAWSPVPSAQDLRLLDPNGYVRDDAYPDPWCRPRIGNT